MRSKGHSVKQLQSGFTLVELLTVIALILIIAGVAVPNFAAMIREQRWTSAIGSIQTAIMRARAYAVSDELDHAVEFCTDQDGTTYLRIEAESAFLESLPNLQQYISVVDSFLYMPDPWTGVFLARRDAWGSDGRRYRSGMLDVYYQDKGTNGHLWPYHGNHRPSFNSMRDHARFFYDYRYPNSKGNLPSSYLSPPPSSGHAPSVSERNNVPDQMGGYQDVNDSNCYVGQTTELTFQVQDNLAVDDYIYLPHDIKVDINHPKSALINYDVDRVGNNSVVHHGWDRTPDLRFGKSGHLLQSQTPEIVITRQGKGGSPDQHMRLRLLRGTGRLRKVN